MHTECFNITLTNKIKKNNKDFPILIYHPNRKKLWGWGLTFSLNSYRLETERDRYDKIGDQTP